MKAKPWSGHVIELSKELGIRASDAGPAIENKLREVVAEEAATHAWNYFELGVQYGQHRRALERIAKGNWSGDVRDVAKGALGWE